MTGPQSRSGGHRAGTPTTDPAATTTTTNRSKLMNLINEDLARAHTAARLGEAQRTRRGHQLVLSRRLSRRAERAAQQAKLLESRSL